MISDLWHEINISAKSIQKHGIDMNNTISLVIYELIENKTCLKFGQNMHIIILKFAE